MSPSLDMQAIAGLRPHAAPLCPAQVWDTHAPTPQQIEAGVQWALAQRASGLPVLVHCAHGHGRSATVLAAILIGELSGLCLSCCRRGA